MEVTEVVKNKEKKIYPFVRSLYDWIDSFAVACVILFSIVGLVFRLFVVVQKSMNPGLIEGDRFIAFNMMYKPERGDIVAITQSRVIHPEDTKPLVKRIIGVEGDIIKFDFENGIVYLNGEILDEPYIAEPTYLQGSLQPQDEVVVEKGKVFVMGDNRNESLDSRDDDIGQIDVRYVVGGMFIRYWPIDRLWIVENPFD